MSHRRYLLEQLDILCGVHLKPKFSDSVANEFIQRLSVFTPQAIAEMFDAAKIALEMPKLGELVEMCRSIEKRLKNNEAVKAIPQRVEDDGSSLISALLSAMWLHYTRQWKESDFEGTVFKKAFSRQFPTMTYNFEELKNTMPKEMVINWMQNFERKHGLKHI